MTVMILAAMASSTLGFAAFTALALAMDRHHEQMLGRRKVPPRQKLAFRAAGWLLLALSLRASVLGWGWSLGSAIWLGLLTLSAITLILLLGWRSRAARWTGIAGLAVGIILSGVLP